MYLAFLFPLILVCACLSAELRPDDNSKSAIYAPDGHGLEKQYQSFVDAYNSGDSDVTDLTSRLAIFGLPDAEGWLAQYFGGEEIKQRKENYIRDLAEYQKSLPTIMSRWRKGTHFRVKCEPYNRKIDSNSRPAPEPDGRFPRTDIPVQKYEVTFIADTREPKGGNSMSGLINVVYVDGAYRFVGGGIYPFWSMPDGSRTPKPTEP
jgi:hypothetical protein